MRTGSGCRTVDHEISRFPRKERLHMPGSLTTPGRPALAMTRSDVLPSTICTVSAPRIRLFRGSMAGLCAPLSTLRRDPRGPLRMTWGRCGSLLLHRKGLSPSTPCRSPGASHMSSGFAPRADIVAACRHVRFVPQADSCMATNSRLFDHFVGDRKQVGRYIEAYRSGGLEVDDELILGRKLDRQVARLGAAQDAIHVGWHAPIHIGETCSVFEQTAFLREILVVNRRHVVADRKPYHRAAMSEHEIIWQQHKTCLLSPEHCDDPLNIGIAPHFGRERLDRQRARGGLERTQIIQTATGRR